MRPKKKPIYLLRRRARLVRELAVIEAQLKRAGAIPVETFPDIRRIQRAMCSRFDVPLSMMLASGRTNRIAWPRMLAMYLARKTTRRSLAEIGRAFNRTAQAVFWAERTADDRIRIYPRFKEEAAAAESDLRFGPEKHDLK